MQACLFLLPKSKTGSLRQQKKKRWNKLHFLGGAAAVCVTFCSHANTANCLAWCRTMGLEMPTMTKYCRFGFKRSPEAGTDDKTFILSLWQNVMTSSAVIAIVHEFIGGWGGGSVGHGYGSRSAVCSAGSLLLGKQDKKDGVWVCQEDGNMGRLSFTQNWREECDQIGCSSPRPCCQWATGSILIGQDTS